MGIRKNFGFNIILTGANYIFPLLVFPYITRIFDAELIGTCNFVESIVNYLVMFSALGLAGFGVREVSKQRDNRKNLDSLFSSLLLINVSLTLFWIIIYLLCVFFIPQLYELRQYCWIGCIKLLTSCLLVEWLFQGLEQFKYITIRAIVVRTIFICLVFLFVKTRSDILIYFFLLMITVALNALVNITYSRKYVRFSFKDIDVKKYIVPLFSFGYYMIFVSFYTLFNSVFLGFISNETEVGYYSISTKIITIALSVFSALNTVMIPQISKWLYTGNTEILNLRINQCLLLVILLASPISVGCIIFASDIVMVIAGEGYEGAVMPLRIVSILVLILGMSQIIMANLSSSIKANRPLILISSFGAFIGISLNVILTRKLMCIGSCLAWTITEILVLFLSTSILIRITPIQIQFRKLILMFIATLIYIPVMLGCFLIGDNVFLRIGFSVFFSLFLMLVFLKLGVKKLWFQGILPNRIERFLS